MEIERVVTDYFKGLFSSNEPLAPYVLEGHFPILTPEMIEEMNRPVSNEEIHATIRNIGAYKAPGPDGYQAIFFQSQWNIVGSTFCKMIKECWEAPSKIKELNETHIALIPKEDNVTSMKQFRPIGLCNVAYKTITKMVTSKLRDALQILIGPAQSSFIPKRQIQDNIIIAQEIFHSMRTKSGKKGWMAIKIDLEKAYDRLRWEFVKDTLEDIGIPSHLIQIIWNCISTTTMQVLWNGEALEAFSTSRGVRQGDPISPYLFVLCIERLFQVIELEVNYNSWKPIQIARGGPKISHLAFADDLLLFAEADTEQADLIQQTLLNFCLSSGQKVSQAKTRIYFSKNVPRMLKDSICNILGYYTLKT